MTLWRSRKSCILHQVNLPESTLVFSNPWLKRLFIDLKPQDYLLTGLEKLVKFNVNKRYCFNFKWREGKMKGLLSLVILVLDFVAIIDVIRSSMDTGKKVLWIILILVLPIIGLILYFFIGRK